MSCFVWLGVKIQVTVAEGPGIFVLKLTTCLCEAWEKEVMFSSLEKFKIIWFGAVLLTVMDAHVSVSSVLARTYFHASVCYFIAGRFGGCGINTL